MEIIKLIWEVLLLNGSALLDPCFYLFINGTIIGFCLWAFVIKIVINGGLPTKKGDKK